MLKLIGTIAWQENPTVSLATWREMIEAFELRPTESCEIANPFTGEPTTLNTPLELAALEIGERRAGVVRWCSRGKGLEIIGEPGPMTRLAKAITARFGGEFEPV